MALTARTWVAGELGTAAKLNTVRDDLSYLNANPANRCVARDASTQAVTTLANIALDTQDVDTASMFASGPEITIPTGGGGWYRVAGRSQVTDNSNPTVQMHIRKNSTSNLDTWKMAPGSATNIGELTARVYWEGTLAAGDTLHLRGEATGSGATFGSATAALASVLSVVGPCPPS